MLKGKFKHIVLGIGVLVVSLGIMRYTPLAFAGNSNPGNFSESRPFNERFMTETRGPRGHHRMMWGYDEEYDGQEDWREFRGHRGCMRYYNDGYDVEVESNK